MNHLKHIRINVPRCAPSNAALRYGHHTGVNCENRRFKSQFLGSNALSAAKKSHGIGIKYSGQFRQNSLRLVFKESKTICKQRSRTKSSVTSLKKKSSLNKKLPLENTARTVCHYSTCQNVIFNRINKEHVSQEVPIMNSTKNTNRHNSFIASVEKHPRSYAELIADYSKILYKESALSSRNDSLYFNNTMRMSPFSTFSTSSSAKKIINISEHNGVPCEERKDDSLLPTTAAKFDRCIRRDNANIDERRNFQHCDTHITEAINKSTNQNCVANDLTGDDQSYIRLVADCSKSMRNIPFLNISNGGLLPKRNVLAKNSLETFATPTRKASGTNTPETIPLIAAMPLEKNINEQTTNSREDWLGEMENVISDLKSFTGRKNAKTASKPEENDILQFESSNSLNRAHRLTELIETYERKKEDTVDGKLDDQFNKVHKMEKLNKDLRKHNYSQFNDKTLNSPRYFSNATNNASVRKHSTQVPAGDSNILKQPQVKLRMVPSEKESIVSINVDSASTGPLDPQNPASKQLSVVVQSDRKGDLQSTENQWNIPTLQRSSKSASQRSDFGPMRISISEDSAPIKQIEFSINGKPVSELKSITARTEKLDVVSSVDKIEIRIPFAKDEANTLSKSKENDLSKGTDSNVEQILNVQISANFQNKFAKSSTEEPAETINTISTLPSQTSKTHYVFNKPAKAYDETLDTNNVQQNESNNATEKPINKHKISDNIGFEIQRKTTKKKATEEANIETGKLKKMTSTVRSPETNTYDKYESSDSRIPSKMVPWWSSSDSFNKIKKKEDDRKPLTPLSNQNEKKTTSSDLNKNLVTESSMLKETSGSKIPTKKIQSTNNEIIAKNNSDNLTSCSNSSEQCIESKPNLRYSYLFRLKPNRENPDIIPDFMENDIKIENNQISIVKNNEKVSEIKQIKSTTVSTSDTINTQSKHDIEDKALILSRKFEAPNSAQDLLSKRNQEKEHNDSLKQTKSINEIFTIKPKIQNNLDVIKPMKKGKDDTLIDDVKISSTKPSGLNNEIKKIQNSPNFSNSSKLVQALENQEKILQANLKSLSKSNTDKADSLPSLTISSETTQKSEKTMEHVETPIELKQNKPNNLSNIKNTSEVTIIKKLEKLNLTSPKLKDNSAKEFTLHKKITDQNKSPLETINEIQTKSTSKVKNNVVTKDSINKNIKDILSTDQSAGKLNKKSDAKIIAAKIITQNPKSKSLLSKDSEENHLRELKANKDRGSFSGSIGFLKKPNGSAGFISSDSKMHTKSRQSNDNCAYAGKLITKSSYSNSDRKDDALSNSQRAVFKIPRNLNNVDDMLEHHAPSVIGNATPWTNMDRPEKSMLYSAWLQRSRNDINKEKLY
ncbi:putative leucine-rich repeat-containing protein DDB_G0290503 [Linepithema humile]|uniref:putative leucine-rich repeat-containing protein DDB_G0290503 n=1 Tax=Linepithema humile TaxID=83485 RepID=UPI00351E3918